jgi:hypothetical protein
MGTGLLTVWVVDRPVDEARGAAEAVSRPYRQLT